MMNNPVDTKSRKRVIQGKVIGVAGAKSVVLLVERKVVHPKYRKIIRRFKKYTIHDEDSRAKVGDLVNAVECRPMSRTKSFVLKNIVVSGVSE